MGVHPRRRGTRLADYTYGQAGAYFVTACVQDRRPLFGVVEDLAVRLSPLGDVVAEEWLATTARLGRVATDEWIVMPDHLHAIVVIDDGATTRLATVIGQFKAAVTRRAQRAGGKTRLWQRGYFDHVVRDERDLDAIRWYIATNPGRWTERHRS